MAAWSTSPSLGGTAPLRQPTLLAQWARSDERKARRTDRRGDDELDAYNAMLAELAARKT
ncbi:hypothetical protein DL990_21695 [Amycolatopsis sp. WAC 01416]|nr:hypothetical protein DL990_21695 [Amycolatopsis sp. WAC 01416]